MGYTIKIGKIEKEFLDDFQEIHLSVVLENDKNAPAFGEATDHENQRWPSYIAWGESVKAFNIYDLFFNKKTGLMRTHPGVYKFDKTHVDIVENEYNIFKQKNPKIIAKFGEGNELGAYMARIEWLLYWMKKSIDCNEASFIENS